MKRYSFIIALFLLANPLYGDSCDCFDTPNLTTGLNNPENGGPCDCNDHFSHTFMFTRGMNQHLSINQFLRHNLIHEKKGEMKSSFELAAVFQESLKFERAAHYFMPSICKEVYLVSGDANLADKKTRDIRAEWLGLPADFRGRFTLCPEQQQMGFILNFNQDIGTIIDSSLLEGMWINVMFPVAAVDNNLNLRQFDVRHQGTAPADIIEAFRQKEWEFAKIVGPRTKIQVPEIQLQLGRTFLSENNFLVAYYSILSIPTGNENDPRFLFSPVAGLYGHVGIGAGVNFQLLLTRDPQDYAATFFLNLESIFIVRNTEKRTFDLKGRPWSRYLLLTHRDRPLGNTTPGVNVLTQEMRVRPYCVADCSLGWRFKTEHVELEIGYEIWGHPDEKIEFVCPFAPVYGIAGDATGILPADLPIDACTVTASKSTISNRAPVDRDSDGKLKFVAVTASDFDLNSAAAQAAIVHKAHMALAFTKKGRSIDGSFGGGFFFDFPQRNTALKLAGAYAKVGAAF